MTAADTTFSLTNNATDQSLELPVISGSLGPDVIDIRKLYGQTGMFTLDPGFTFETVRIDHTDASGRFGMVDVKALMPMTKPVTLADIKGEPKLHDLALVRQSRLSVLPVDDASWALICHMGETDA